MRKHKLEELSPEKWALTKRRDFLMQASGGLGAVALSALLAEDAFGADDKVADPLAPKSPHHKPRATSVIWLFMEGGPSHLDTFDPKPALERLAGQPMPESFGRPITAMGTASNTIMPTRRVFTNYGRNGIPISDWLPHTAKHADDLAIVRSCWADGLNHVGSVCQMNTGSVLAGRPSLGAWTTYHATIMHLLGLNHFRTLFSHNGRLERATINDGEVIKDLIS